MLSGSVQTTGALWELPFLERPLCAWPSPHSPQGAPELRGGCDSPHFGEEETGSERPGESGEVARLMGSRAGTRTHVFPVPLAFRIPWRLVILSKHPDLWTQRSHSWLCLLLGQLCVSFSEVKGKANSPLLHNGPACTFLSPESLWPPLPLSCFTHTLLPSIRSCVSHRLPG